MSSSEFPRVLIVSPSAFNLTSGTGFLLSNLFRGWPVDSLASVHFDSISPDDSVCRRFFRLSKKEIRWVFPFYFFQQSGASNQAGYAAQTSSPSVARRVLKKIFGNQLPWKTCLTTKLQAWIEDFRPDILYVHPSVPYMGLMFDIAQKNRIPLVIHVMDDWLAAYGKSGLVSAVLRYQASRQLKKLVQAASLRMGISPAMCRVYAQRYGVPFIPFYNGVDVAVRAPFSRVTWEAASPFKIIYIGSIVPYAQLESLRDVCRAVATLAGSATAIQLEICSPHAASYRSELEIHPAILLKSALDEDHVAQALACADVLLLPVNFDELSRRFLRYSFPAKLPLYMLMGTPILVYGPVEVGYVAQALEEKWGFVVERRDPRALQAAIEKLMTDKNVRQQIGLQAKSVAAKTHCLDKIKSEFWTQLRRLGKNSELSQADKLYSERS